MTQTTGTARRDSARTALIAVAALVLGAIGGHLLRAAGAVPRTVSRDDAELQRTLASIRAEIEGVRRLVAEPRAAVDEPPSEPRRENVV